MCLPALRRVHCHIEEAAAFVDRQKVFGEHQRQDRHELHQNVEGRAGGVLERVAHGVTHHRGLVHVGALRCNGRSNGEEEQTVMRRNRSGNLKRKWINWMLRRTLKKKEGKNRNIN